MNYTLWIDNQAVGPLDLCQLSDLFVRGVATRNSQIRVDNGVEEEPWSALGNVFPSIGALPTSTEAVQRISAEIRSAKAATPVAPQRVSIAEVSMPFGSMVGFIIKWTLASIPALLILWAIFLLIGILLGAMFGGVIGLLHH